MNQESLNFAFGQCWLCKDELKLGFWIYAMIYAISLLKVLKNSKFGTIWFYVNGLAKTIWYKNYVWETG